MNRLNRDILKKNEDMSRCEMTLVFNIVCSYANKMIKEKYPNSFVHMDGKSKNPQRYRIYDWEHIEEFSVNIVAETQERVYNFIDSITFKLFKLSIVFFNLLSLIAQFIVISQLGINCR